MTTDDKKQNQQNQNQQGQTGEKGGQQQSNQEDKIGSDYNDDMSDFGEDASK